MTPPTLSKKTIAVIGCGQIGGSIIKRLSQLKPKITLLAHDRDRRLSARVARHAEWVTDFNCVIDRADVVIVATPVPAIVSILGRIATAAQARKPKLLVLDTGTVRQAIHAEAAEHKSRFDHIGLHPLAGADGEGWDSSRAELFAGKRIAVTPGIKSRLPIVCDLLKALGAIPLPMDPKTHDCFVAEAIGLPHLLAFAANGMSVENPLRAGSWESLTRVAASNPEMVAGFLSANASEQKRAIVRFERELARLKKSLSDRSRKAILKLLTERQRLES